MLINVILGNCFNEELDNLENFKCNLVPQVGMKIITKKFGVCRVKDIMIDYVDVQYINKKGRGSEIVFVFVE